MKHYQKSLKAIQQRLTDLVRNVGQVVILIGRFVRSAGVPCHGTNTRTAGLVQIIKAVTTDAVASKKQEAALQLPAIARNTRNRQIRSVGKAVQ